MSALRFAYLTDTHIGCDAGGYQLQPRYLGRETALFQGLGRWLKEKRVTFVVHGGDLTDHGLPHEMRRAGELCSLLGVPVYLCLGNHDLAQADSMRHWSEVSLPNVAIAHHCFAVDVGAARLIMTSHHWHSQVDHQWITDAPQTPRLDADQQEALRALLAESARPAIAVTHAPLNEVPAAQRGTPVPFHPPHEPYLDTWRRLGTEHRNLRLVLCGHNHAHSRHDHGTFVSCTTAAFGEAPAQLRLITVRPDAIQAQTVALAQELGWAVALEPQWSWCVGAPGDHAFSLPMKTGG